jgi:hypothetical protein
VPEACVTINEHISEFAGLPVAAFDPNTGEPDDPAGFAWRISTDYEGGSEEFARLWTALTSAQWAGQIKALIIGEWGEAYDTAAPIGEIVAASNALTGLRALFVGEMTFEEQEISWINQADITPIFAAYPALEILTIRGAEGLALSPVKHESLRELTMQSGGLPADVVRAVGDCELPALTHLELWLGTDNYGGDATTDDLAGILAGSRLPSLKYLGLKDAEIADLVAAAVASAPVIARLETLDLSMGMLSDTGASALVTGQPLTHLRALDLHHHYMSEPMMQRLRDELAPAGVALNLDDAGDPGNEDDRYIEVAE